MEEWFLSQTLKYQLKKKICQDFACASDINYMEVLGKCSDYMGYFRWRASGDRSIVSSFEDAGEGAVGSAHAKTLVATYSDELLTGVHDPTLLSAVCNIPRRALSRRAIL